MNCIPGQLIRYGIRLPNYRESRAKRLRELGYIPRGGDIFFNPKLNSALFVADINGMNDNEFEKEYLRLYSRLCFTTTI